MAVDRKNNGVNQLLIIFFGLILVIGAVLIYLYILRGVFGRFDSADLVPNVKSIEAVLEGKTSRVAILNSRYTENMLPRGSSWQNDNINTWKKFLSNAKLKYEVINDRIIEQGKHYDYDLIILPGSMSLSDIEIIQIKKYVDNGGSIFATTGIASYSNDGKWRGWDFFSEVFGIKFTKEIEGNESSKIHTMRGSLPLTANIPTGYPLKVATWDRPIAVEVLDPRTIQASFWYNYRTESGLVREEIKKSAGIVYGNYGKGRFVWMGFEINSVVGVQEDYIYFERLFNNSINWLTYTPIAFIRDWPNGYSAAAVITPTLDADISNIENLLPVLSYNKVPAAFFVDAETAEQNSNIVAGLSGYGEIAALVNIGYKSSVHDTINKLNDTKTQTQTLLNAKQRIERVSNSSVKGAFPYYGLYDKNTINALIKAGYNYIITDSLTDRSVPVTYERDENKIVGMTKTARDDYEIIRDYGLTQPEFQLYTYQEDIDRILFESGMYVFKLHTSYQCKPENIGVVSSVIGELKDKNFWITTGNEIQKWCANKDFIQLSVERRGNRRVALNIYNSGKEEMGKLVLQVDMNTNAKNINLSSEIIGTKKAKYEYNSSTRIMYVFIDNLEPDESRTYYIDYDINS